MNEVDPMNSSRTELEELVSQKKNLSQQVELMEKQYQIYLDNKEFFDKLLMFHSRIEELKQVKEDIIDLNVDLSTASERLEYKIETVETALERKDVEKEELLDLLQTVREIKSQIVAK